MSSEWRRLKILQRELPPLLFQYTWTRQGYELYVTDLTFIWSERLSRKEILKRADENATTIDPSEDLDQLDLLLIKVGEALRGDEGTATALNSGTLTDALELNTSTKLPAPLRPLQWTLQMSKEPASSTTSHLVLPLLRDAASWESHQRTLLDQLKQKDWVLGKLFDRFEALGVDLGTVFPGAAGLRTARRGSSRSEAAKFIKGVAPFDEQSWLDESDGPSTNFRMVSHLVHELAGSKSGLDLERLRPSQDSWWSGLQRSSETKPAEVESTRRSFDSQRKMRTNASRSDVDLDGETTSASDVDDFEEQEVVPRERLHGNKSDIAPRKGKNRPQSPLSEPRAEHPTEASEPEPELPSPPRQSRTPTAPASPPPKRPIPAPSAAEPIKKPKKGLGVIGGKKKTPVPEPAPTPSPPLEPTPQPKPTEVHASPSKAKRPTKMGLIGGKTKVKAAHITEKPPARQQSLSPPPDQKSRGESPAVKQSATEQVSHENRPPKASVPVNVPAVGETEKQRADRKREELKRQLEAKSKAPAKKKRKF